MDRMHEASLQEQEWKPEIVMCMYSDRDVWGGGGALNIYNAGDPVQMEKGLSKQEMIQLQ